MNISIRWKDMSEHVNLKQYLIDKIAKIYEFSFVEDNIKAEYVYYKKTQEYKLRLNIKIHRGEILRAESKSKNAETATINCIEKLIDQLRRVKTKVNSQKH